MRTSFPTLLLLLVGLGACGNPVPSEGDRAPSTAVDPASATQAEGPKAVEPPFAVSGSLEGLMLTWFDAEGVHQAKSRDEIPEASRQYVRIQSLRVSPDKRLDPDQVYVADVRKQTASGGYPVKLASRDWFEAQIDRVAPVPVAGDVVLYMASWCGACKSAARYLTSRGVDFVEKDVEKDPAAQAEMQKKARAAGKTPRGVPVIDFKGNIMLGFDKSALARLIDAG